MTLRTCAALLGLLVVATLPTRLVAQTNISPLPGATGEIRAVAFNGDYMYIGGDFTSITTPAHYAAQFDTLGSGTLLPNALPPIAGGDVRAVVPDAMGGFYIGGSFTHVGGQPLARLAYINPDGSVSSTFTPAVGNNLVTSLALHNGVLYLGGTFTQLGGELRGRLGAVNAQTGALLDWNPNASSTVNALAISGTTLYVGGSFTTFMEATVNRNRLAAFDLNSLGNENRGLISWNPNASSSVNTLVVSGSTVYVGGNFTQVGEQPRNRVAAIGTDGMLTGWNPNANNVVSAIAVSGSTVYLGGSFTILSAGTVTRNRLAAVNLSDGAVTSWDPGANNTVNAVTVVGTTVYVGGLFTQIDGENRTGVAAVRASTGAVTGWSPTLATSSVNVIVPAGNNLIVGGNFVGVNLIPRSRIAEIDLRTGAYTARTFEVTDGSVRALTVHNNILYAGGTFTQASGSTRNRLAAWDLVDATLSNWNPNAADGQVNTLLANGDVLYVGGTFTTVGGQPRNRLAALQFTDGQATLWNPNAGEAVNALHLSGDTLYVGGAFTTMGGTAPRERLAAFDLSNSGALLGWNPSVGGTVNALATRDTVLYVGGIFTTAGGTTRNRLAAFHTTEGTVLDWNPNVGFTGTEVRALLHRNGYLYAGGTFTTVGAQPRNRLVIVDAITGQPTEWNPQLILSGSPTTINAVATDGYRWIAGGNAIIGANGLPRRNLAAFTLIPATQALSALTAYTQDFTDFTNLNTLPPGWSIGSGQTGYGGGMGSSSTPGVRGGGSLGVHLGAFAPDNTFQANFGFTNDTGSSLVGLRIQYRGLVRDVELPGTPSWTVSVNGTNVPLLAYPTADGKDSTLVAVVAGLNVADGASVDVRWSATYPGSASREIGLTDVRIERVYGATIMQDSTFVLLASPVPATYASVLEMTSTQGLPGANVSIGYPNVWDWDTATQWWKHPADLNTTLEAGQGFLTYVFPRYRYGNPNSAIFPRGIGVNGTPHTLPITPAVEGGRGRYTLLGNPSPQTLDWDLVTRNDSVGATVRVLNSATSQWMTWNGLAGDLSDGLIAPLSGFLVEAAGVGPSLEITEGALSTGGVFRGKTEQEPYRMRLFATGNGLEASTWVAFHEEAREGADRWDARYQNPLSSSFIRIGTHSPEGTLLDINVLPVGPRMEVPLRVEATQSGTYVLEATTLNLPEGMVATFVDTQSDVSAPLDSTFRYSFTLEALPVAKMEQEGLPLAATTETSTAPRFVLRFEGGSATSAEAPDLPLTLALHPAYPNPTTGRAMLDFALPRSERVRLQVFDVLGRHVATLADGVMEAGRHSATLNANLLPPGLYVYRLEAGERTLTQRVTVVR